MEINVFKRHIGFIICYLLKVKQQPTPISLPPQFLWQPFRGYACL